MTTPERLIREYHLGAKQWDVPNNGEASPLDDPGRIEHWWWWLKTTWKKHWHTAVEIHPLLVQVLDAKTESESEQRAREFLTVGRVCEMLDAKDPPTLVDEWIGAVPANRAQIRLRPLGLPDRVCAWESCGLPVRAVNAKYCETHAAAARRDTTRKAVRRLRGKQSTAPLDLAK